MPSAHSRRDVLRVCGIAVGLGTGGCLGESGAANSPSTTSKPTVSPSVVSDGDARARALTAEEAHLTDALSNASCVEEWGLTPHVGQEATVTDRTATASA